MSTNLTPCEALPAPIRPSTRRAPPPPLPNPAQLAALARLLHFKIAPIAKRCGLCERQFLRQFRRRYGRTPQSYFNRLRLGLFAEGRRAGKSDKELAQELSFWDASHLCHFVKHHLKITPK
ncbi:MAG TPA: helix-turn-helix domain-containing protein [Candidatus Binatia bacterium]|jgi:AraC-like DNA-binding protein|nr:helix-turn-helix domain-containing protein [Candidatus Binatia bacterium]